MILSTNSDNAKVVEYPSLNPNWGVLNIINLVKTFYRRSYTIFSNFLLIFDNTEIGR